MKRPERFSETKPIMERVMREVSPVYDMMEKENLKRNAQYINDLTVERQYIQQDLIALREEVETLKSQNQDLVEKNNQIRDELQ